MKHIIQVLCIVWLSIGGSLQQQECSKLEYDRCVQIADPLVREAHLVFPDNMDDIDLVCRTWNQFVDCLKSYTERCFTDQQRRQFNKAVENPIESVHQMCMQPQYQKEYLQYAPCIKGTIIDKNRCGPHYSLLVDQVAQGEIISKATLCCSHDRFKQCVYRETRNLCDRGAQDGPAAVFSAQILEKALSFLQEQCFNYIPNSGDCTTVNSDMSIFPDRSAPKSTAPSEVYPWSTVSNQQENNIISGKEVPPPRIATPKQVQPQQGSRPVSWMPSSSASSFPENTNTYQTDSSTQILGSRTRPASYGRSSSWSEGSGSVGSNTVQPYSPSQTPPTPSSPRPEWTTSSWNVHKPNVMETTASPEQPTIFATHHGTETWYPAAGNQLSNEVDEPNQQGLKYNKNNNSAWSISSGGFFDVTQIASLLLTIIVNNRA
ncbi:uncharacterized protein [Atheta coriaria]|uniref:uncharacterized protein n=1 Tax=Dalotia coriaria TaxID=877792 RepID=UPI0031F44115